MTTSGAAAGDPQGASSGQLSIVLNGEARSLAAGTTLATLVDQLELAKGRFAVEVNEEIVPRSQLAERPLAAGDRVEIIGFVGGG